jgi:hypothetical protein
MSYRRKISESESNRLPRKCCATAQARIAERSNRTRNGDISRKSETRGAVPYDVCFVGVEPTVSRAGIEPAVREYTTPTLLHQKHDCCRRGRCRTTLAQSPKRRKPPGQTRRLSRRTRKTAYICLKSAKAKAGTAMSEAGAHDCPTTPVRLRLEQLRYTTAFMTRRQCTHRDGFVNGNVRHWR